MRILTKSIVYIIAAVAALSSCKKDDTLQYNNLTMGNIVDGTFISDQGNIFTVVENNTLGDITQVKRALVLCDVLKKVENTDNEYEVRLNNFAEVLTKNPINLIDADADKDNSVKDPIYIQQAWISGGYLNINFVIEFKTGSTQKHLVNLVLDEEASVDGKYCFEFRHNSFGEASIYDEIQLTFGSGYVSFPIKDIITEDSAELTIGHKWYQSTGAGLLKDTQDYKKTISYTKGGFEQAPATLAVKATTNLN